MTEQKVLTEYGRAALLWGETIQEFAARIVGDAARWQELVAINGLVFPYVAEMADPERGIAGYGDALIIPKTPQTEVARVEEDEAFGRDIALERGGKFSVSGGDLVMAKGRANLSQAIRHRILTKPGELIYHKAYGCRAHELIGDKMPRIASRLAAMYVQSALMRDDRVVGTPVTTASAAGDSISIEAKVETKYGMEIVRTEI